MELETKECLIGIDLELINKVRKEDGSLIEAEAMAYSLPKSNRVKNTMKPFWQGDANAYMKIRNKNCVLMHVKDGYCIVIPEFIRTCCGEDVNVVEELKHYYYSINPNGDVVTSSHGENGKLLYRQLMALKYGGDINKNISSDLEVHHKGWRFLNLIETMMLVTQKHHDEIHTRTTAKSHRAGKVLHSVEEFEMFINSILKKIEYCSNRE